MDIFLTKDGKTVGPFSAKELRAKIAAGEADLDESAWSAEVGDWKRLEVVLKEAESPPAPDSKPAGAAPIELKRFGSPKSSQPAQEPEPVEDPKEAKKREKKAAKEEKEAEPTREKSTKLRPQGGGPPGVPSAAGKKGKGGGPGPVRALASDRGSGKGGNGFAMLGGLRWLALLGFAIFLFSIFLPWVSVTANFGEATAKTNLSAVSQVMAKPVEFSLPGSEDAPKYFRVSKIILLAVGLVAVLAGVLSFLGALDPRGSNWLAVLLCFVGIGGLVAFGVIQTRSIQGQFERALERVSSVGEPVGEVAFTLGSGYFFGIAALVLMAAFLVVPRERNASPVAFFVLLLGGLGLGGWGAKELGGSGEEILRDAFADMTEAGQKVGNVVKEKAEEGIDVIKDKIDKGGDSSSEGGS